MTTVVTEATESRTLPDSRPWGWGEAITLHLAVLMVAFAIQWKLTIIGGMVVRPPLNWIIMLSLTGIAILLGALLRNTPWMRWLSGVKFAVVAITTVSILSLIGTFIPSDLLERSMPLAQRLHEKNPSLAGLLIKSIQTLFTLGFRHIFTAVPFLAMVLLMLVNLSSVLGRRLMVRKPGNLGFVLNHAGLILVIVGMVAGSAQFVQANLHLQEGMPNETAVDDRERGHDIGAAVTLKEFEIEWFPERLEFLRVIDAANHQFQASQDHQWVEAGRTFTLQNYRGRILQYLPSAHFDIEKETWTATEHDSAVKAAELEVVGPDGETTRGWITSRQNFPGLFLQPDDSHVFYMRSAAPKAYRSYLTITGPDGKPRDTVVGVNQPITIGQWQLYQSSYARNDMTGRMDSVLQAVRDPALPLVYLGFFALLVGAFVTFWVPARRPEETVTDEETTPDETATATEEVQS